MKIIIRNSDNLILYAADDLALSDIATGDNWRDRTLNTGNATLIDNVTLNQPFVSGAFAYINGAVTTVNSAAIRNKYMPDAIKKKKQEIQREYDLAVAKLTDGYDSYEIASFPQQAEEAKAKNANSNAATPLIDALATARGMTTGELVARIIGKEAVFRPAFGTILGKRQGKMDALNNIDFSSENAIDLINQV